MEDEPSSRSPILNRLTSYFGSNATDANSGVNGTHVSETGKSTHDIRLRVSEFEAARVEDVMIPRAEIVAIDISTSFDDAIDLFAEATHSRLPVYRETLDDPAGFVHIKDIVAAMSAARSAGNCASGQDGTPEPPTLTALKRDILFVPASMRLTDLLVKMQTTRIHLALVVDEYGGTDGLVSLEDLVEEIVGEIEDEHDDDAPSINKRSKGIWEADARIEIEDVEDQAGLALALPDYEDEIDTLGGVVFAIAGRVPQRGEIIRHPTGVDFEILDADPRRIKRLRVRTEDAKPATPPTSETAAKDE